MSKVCFSFFLLKMKEKNERREIAENFGEGRDVERQGAGTDLDGSRSTGHPFTHFPHVLFNPLKTNTGAALLKTGIHTSN